MEADERAALTTTALLSAHTLVVWVLISLPPRQRKGDDYSGWPLKGMAGLLGS